MNKINRRRYLASTAATMTTLSLAGCGEDEAGGGSGDADNDGSVGTDDGNGSDVTTESQSKVEILSHEYYADTYTEGFKGVIQNVSDEELSYVEVKGVFLTSDGTQIGEGLDNVSGLEAGRKWEFDCMYLGTDEDRIDSYEFEVSYNNY